VKAATKTKVERGFWLLSLLIISFIAKGEELYKGTDPTGIVRYSDKPFPGSKSYTLNPLPVFSASPSLNKEIPKTEKTDIAYQLQIVFPENNQIFSVDMQSIQVKLSFTPTAPPNAKIRLVLNGESLPLFSNLNELTLQTLPRGTYQLQAALLSPQNLNQITAISDTVTFYQQRPFVKK
jgi:hypothetical protein